MNPAEIFKIDWESDHNIIINFHNMFNSGINTVSSTNGTAFMSIKT